MNQQKNLLRSNRIPICADYNIPEQVKEKVKEVIKKNGHIKTYLNKTRDESTERKRKFKLPSIR